MIKIGCFLCYYQLMMFVSTLLGRIIMRPSYDSGKIVNKRTGAVLGNASREEVERHRKADIKKIKAIPLKDTYLKGAFILNIFLAPILLIKYDPTSPAGVSTNMYTGMYGWGFTMDFPTALPLLIRVVILLGVMAIATYLFLKVSAAIHANRNIGFCIFIFAIRVVETILAIANLFTDRLMLIMPYVAFVEIGLAIVTLIVLRGISANDFG